MQSLADVAPPEMSAEEIDIRGKKLTVYGLSGEEWMRLYALFPDMAAVLSGQAGAQMWGVTELKAYSATAASALGAPGDAKTEAEAGRRFSRDDFQLILVTTIRLSMPGDVYGPLLNGAEPPNPAPVTEAPATK